LAGLVPRRVQLDVGQIRGLGPDACRDTKAAVWQFYEDFVASGANKLHHDLARLVVDRDRILTEGVMRMEYPGARTLATMWIDVDDLDAH
jgi:hypothetical protein